MHLIIVRTNIKTSKKARQLKAIFKPHPLINRWTVDTEDIDNVLRIEGYEPLSENEVLGLLRTGGFYGEPLPD
jgi:hypothetical protein